MLFLVEALQTAGQVVSNVRVLDYRVLGELEVVADGIARPLGGPKQRAVLAVLVAAAGRPLSVDSLLQAIP